MTPNNTLDNDSGEPLKPVTPSAGKNDEITFDIVPLGEIDINNCEFSSIDRGAAIEEDARRSEEARDRGEILDEDEDAGCGFDDEEDGEGEQDDE